MIKNNKVLIHLDLSNNLLKDDFSKTAIDALKYNMHILVILLEGNFISNKWIISISNALVRNKKLEERKKIPRYIREIEGLKKDLTKVERQNNNLITGVKDYDKIKEIADADREELDTIEARDREMRQEIEIVRTDAKQTISQMNKEIAELEAKEERIKNESDGIINKLNEDIKDTIDCISKYKECSNLYDNIKLVNTILNGRDKKAKVFEDEESKLKKFLGRLKEQQ